MKKTILSLLIALGLIGSASADTFGTGSNQFTLDFTTIGNAGNAADPLTGYGSVGYNYRIGTYDISQNQVDAATASGLQGVTGGAWSGDKPAANISWYQAAAFVNWLDTSTGHQAAYNLTYSNGSYTMDLWHSWDAGYDPNNLYRNKNAVYVLPSEDEWYKAAYGKSDGSRYYLYPTGSDSAPTAVASGTDPNTAVYNQPWVSSVPSLVQQAGGLSSYGTMGQGGNVWQWMESSYGGNNIDPQADRKVSGASYYDSSNWMKSDPAGYQRGAINPDTGLGFRVAAVPEPSTYALFGIGALAMVAYRRKVA